MYMFNEMIRGRKPKQKYGEDEDYAYCETYPGSPKEDALYILGGVRKADTVREDTIKNLGRSNRQMVLHDLQCRLPGTA